MKKAAVVSMLVLAAVAVAGIIPGKTNRIAASPEENTGEEAEGESEEEQVEDPLLPEIDTSVQVEAGSRIAVVSKNTEGQFWERLQAGMADAVKAVNEAYGFSKEDAVTMTFEGPDDEREVETQINTLDAVIAENPAVLCLSAGDMESCQAQLETAAENGIPVVVFDSNVADTDLVGAFRSTDNQKAGEMAADKLAEALNGSGKIAVFSAQEKTASIQDRIRGFQKKIAESEGIEVAEIIYQDSVEDMEAAMKEALEKYPDLAGVYCTNADISEMYLGLKKPENSSIVMVGTDATDKQQKAVKDGTELGIVSQDPYAMGYITILTAFDLTKEGVNVEKNSLLEPQWIDSNNIEDPAYSNYIY